MAKYSHYDYQVFTSVMDEFEDTDFNLAINKALSAHLQIWQFKKRMTMFAGIYRISLIQWEGRLFNKKKKEEEIASNFDSTVTIVIFVKFKDNTRALFAELTDWLVCNRTFKFKIIIILMRIYLLFCC